MPWDATIPNLLAGEGRALAGNAPAEAMDNEQFAGFYARSAQPLWAYLARVSRDAALADDLAQESYVRFLCATIPEEGEVAARRYLFKIATNLLRDHWRKPQSSSIEDTPEHQLQARCGTALAESQAMLGPAMAQMRPLDRQILWLAYAEGYTHREIAQITGLASPSIRLLLFRARRKMAGLLRKEANS